MSDYDQDDDVLGQSLGKPGLVAPPAELAESVMRDVNAFQARLSLWQRWRRARQAGRLANFPVRPRVDKAIVQISLGSLGGVMTTKSKMLLATAGAAAVAIAAFAVIGSPPYGQGTEAPSAPTATRRQK